MCLFECNDHYLCLWIKKVQPVKLGLNKNVDIMLQHWGRKAFSKIKYDIVVQMYFLPNVLDGVNKKPQPKLALVDHNWHKISLGRMALFFPKSTFKIFGVGMTNSVRLFVELETIYWHQECKTKRTCDIDEAMQHFFT